MAFPWAGILWQIDLSICPIGCAFPRTIRAAYGCVIGMGGPPAESIVAPMHGKRAASGRYAFGFDNTEAPSRLDPGFPGMAGSSPAVTMEAEADAPSGRRCGKGARQYGRIIGGGGYGGCTGGGP